MTQMGLGTCRCIARLRRVAQFCGQLIRTYRFPGVPQDEPLLRLRSSRTLPGHGYPLAMPAVGFLHWKRAFVNYRRVRQQAGLRPKACLAALVLAAAWGLGEAIGALMGANRVSRHVWRTEVKPVSREDVARSTAQELRAPVEAARA